MGGRAPNPLQTLSYSPEKTPRISAGFPGIPWLTRFDHWADADTTVAREAGRASSWASHFSLQYEPSWGGQTCSTQKYRGITGLPRETR